MGIAHRGRMNVLANVLEYPPKDIFYKISGKGDIPYEIYNFQDDVPHHISTSNKLSNRNTYGKESSI
jgi:probable 2-oxoglutarate dehydrogenase E1 component DHKTD1